MSDDEQWCIASADRTQVQPRGIRTGRKARRAISAPAGLCHAYRPGDAATACGLALDELHPFDDLRWPGSFTSPCGACEMAARPAG